jgi:hypothetical protein
MRRIRPWPRRRESWLWCAGFPSPQLAEHRACDGPGAGAVEGQRDRAHIARSVTDLDGGAESLGTIRRPGRRDVAGGRGRASGGRRAGGGPHLLGVRLGFVGAACENDAQRRSGNDRAAGDHNANPTNQSLRRTQRRRRFKVASQPSIRSLPISRPSVRPIRAPGVSGRDSRGPMRSRATLRPCERARAAARSSTHRMS